MLSLVDIAHTVTDQHIVSLRDKLTDTLRFGELPHHGCIYVTDECRALKGVVTDGDIRRILCSKANISGITIADVMTTEFIKIYEEALIVDAYRLMAENEINHLPIVDSNDIIIGFVSFHELAEHLSPEQIFIDLAESTNRTLNERRHISRYTFATNFIRPGGRVLDCACGAGYGSNILSKNGNEVTGIDFSSKAIEYANKYYSVSSSTYKVEDIADLTFPDNTFNAIVSLETLEHISNEVCKAYLSNISRWLKPSGILVSSSPMLRYKEGKPYITNPYHINELPKAELIKLFETYLPGFVLQLYYQDEDRFVPLLDEDTGFCILVARKT